MRLPVSRCADHALTLLRAYWQKTASGLLIPEKAKNKLNEGQVLAVGPGGRDSHGNLIPVAVKVGDVVLLPEYGGNTIKLGDQDEVRRSGRGELERVPHPHARTVAHPHALHIGLPTSPPSTDARTCACSCDVGRVPAVPGRGHSGQDPKVSGAPSPPPPPRLQRGPCRALFLSHSTIDTAAYAWVVVVVAGARLLGLGWLGGARPRLLGRHQREEDEQRRRGHVDTEEERLVQRDGGAPAQQHERRADIVEGGHGDHPPDHIIEPLGRGRGLAVRQQEQRPQQLAQAYAGTPT
jgi:co-chaperonin GroES (HSP10)